MEDTATNSPQALCADLKALHRQLEERFARAQAERAQVKETKKTGEPVAFSAGR
jgi:hypothetical protein